MELTYPSTPVEVETIDGSKVRYFLAFFCARGKDADAIHEDIRENSLGRTTLFAADFVPDYNHRDWLEFLS